MRLAVVVLMATGMSGCDYLPGANKEASIGCINHANAIATDAELQMMRTGYDDTSELIIKTMNCRYYFFNPDAKTDKGMRKEEIEACEELRPKFHAVAKQRKEQAQAICFSLNESPTQLIR